MVSSRPYADHCDLEILSTFLTHERQDIHHVYHLHTGDLVWQLFHMQTAFAASDIIHLWEDANGAVIGFVLLYPTFGSFYLDVTAHHRSSALEEEMLTWAETQLRAQSRGIGRCATLVNQHDMARIELLAQHGYTADEPWLYMQRPLATPISPPAVPPGFRVRHLRDASEAPSRATVLAAAFGARPQIEAYLKLMHAPGYSHELDFVAVAPDGQFAAFALAWLDPVNKVGQFEPVGTAPAFQQMGLGRAVVLEGMRQMQLRGMEHVIVIVEEGEHAARRLYESVGLTVGWNLALYSRANL
jgi:mycothiol synthase